jgi:hypothetical protein
MYSCDGCCASSSSCRNVGIDKGGSGRAEVGIGDGVTEGCFTCPFILSCPISRCLSGIFKGEGTGLSTFLDEAPSFVLCPREDCFRRRFGGVDNVLVDKAGRSCRAASSVFSLLSLFRVELFILSVTKLPCLLVLLAVGRPLCSSFCPHCGHEVLSF